nr:transmembrane protein 106C [Ipomoea batatas]
MTSSRHSEPPPPSCSTQERYFHPLPAEPQTPQYIIVLPNYYRSHSYISRTCRRRLIYSAGLLLLAVTVFLLWPSDPGVSVSRLKLRGFRVHPFPPSLDISLDLIVKVQNRDFYSVDYNALIVSVAYRRKRLGYVTSEEGHLKARASSYINATLQLKGVEIITDVLPLIEDVARGSVTFDTVTEISGQLGLFLLDLPLQGKVSCEIVVDTKNETISHQNCYPEITNQSSTVLVLYNLRVPDQHLSFPCWTVIWLLAPRWSFVWKPTDATKSLHLLCSMLPQYR